MLGNISDWLKLVESSPLCQERLQGGRWPNRRGRRWRRWASASSGSSWLPIFSRNFFLCFNHSQFSPLPCAHDQPCGGICKKYEKSSYIWGSWTVHWTVLGMFLFLFLFLLKGMWSGNWVWGQGFCPLHLKIHDFRSKSESKTNARQLWAISIGWDAPMEAELEGWAVLGALVRAQVLPGRSCRTYLPCPASLVPQPTCCFFRWGPCAAPPPILLSCLLLSTQNHKDASNTNMNKE